MDKPDWWPSGEYYRLNSNPYENGYRDGVKNATDTCWRALCKQGSFLIDVYKELDKANEIFEPFHSHHEAYAVLMEEVDEYWDIVRQKPSLRCPQHARRELVQIAAMAMRAAISLGLEKGAKS